MAVKAIFWNSTQRRLRAGWRILAFGAVFLAGFRLSKLIFQRLLLGASWFESPGSGVGQPGPLIFVESLVFASALFAAWLVPKLERRSLGDAGLPLNSRGGRLLGIGLIFGFAEMGLTMSLIWLLGGLSVEGVALAGMEIVRYAVLWAIAMSIVALLEEFLFRGYLLETLSSGIGFSPAAAILSAVFGGAHLLNPGGTWFGALYAASFGLFACFAVRRTGNLWFGIGFHAAANYADTFVFSLKTSGMPAAGQLLTSRLQGPSWLTGGTFGPEASLANFAVFTLLIVVFARLFSPVAEVHAPI